MRMKFAAIIILFVVLDTATAFYNWSRKRYFIVNTFCPRPGGIFSFPGDCNTYVTCTYNRGCLMNCPKGLEFSPHLRVCTTPDKSQCQTDPLFETIEPPPPCHKGYAMPNKIVPEEKLPDQSVVDQIAIQFPESLGPGPTDGLPIWPKPITSAPQEIFFPEPQSGSENEQTGEPTGETVEPMTIAGPDLGTIVEQIAAVGPDTAGYVGSEEAESEEDSGEATFEDWQDWIEFFNKNRHNAPAFLAVRDSFMDPRFSHSGQPKVPFKRFRSFKYKPSNPRSFYFHHHY